MTGKLLGLLSLLTSAIATPLGAQISPPAPPPAPQTGITRTDLLQHDLSIPGRETIQTRVDFAPGAAAPQHMHPGEEIVYVLKGTLEYRLRGQPMIRLNAGDVLFIPYGTVHAVVNVGLDSASELATYVVEKDKPLVMLIK